MLERIDRDGELIALIVRASYNEAGIHFFTPSDLSQQLAFMRHPAGKQIEPHSHQPVPRSVLLTQEVLVIRRGKLRVDFYDSAQKFFRSEVLGPGDVILLAGGGHGFEVLEEVEMFEVKQGPYAGDHDKRRFLPAGKPPR